MSYLPHTLENLASMGVNIEITKETKFLPHTLKKIVQIVVSNQGHITIEASGNLPHTFEELAKIGGKNLTLKF